MAPELGCQVNHEEPSLRRFCVATCCVGVGQWWGLVIKVIKVMLVESRCANFWTASGA